MAKKTKSQSDGGASIAVTIGGETFEVAKSTTHFAVRKRRRASFGELESSTLHPEKFPQLELSRSHSTRAVEVYRVEADSLDSAMETLRTEGRDVEWCEPTTRNS